MKGTKNPFATATPAPNEYLFKDEPFSRSWAEWLAQYLLSLSSKNTLIDSLIWSSVYSEVFGAIHSLAL